MKKKMLQLVFATFLIIVIGRIYANRIYANTKLQPNKVTVLMYHHVIPQEYIKGVMENNNAVLSLEIFEEQMKYLHENDYNIITLKELQEYIYNDKIIPDNSILITFDDGYKSNFTYVYPVLKGYNFKGTIFLITSAIQETYEETFVQEKLQFASIKELKECSDVFTYGDHTYKFHKKDTETNKAFMVLKSEEDIRADIKASSLIMSKYIDEDTKAFAYPYGAYTKTSQQVLQDNDYKLVFLTRKGQVNKKSNPYYIPRYGISSREDFNQLFKNDN